MAGFVTQEPVEVLGIASSNAVVTQQAVEVLVAWSPVAVVTQIVVEVLHVYVSQIPADGIIIKGS